MPVHTNILDALEVRTRAAIATAERAAAMPNAVAVASRLVESERRARQVGVPSVLDFPVARRAFDLADALDAQRRQIELLLRLMIEALTAESGSRAGSIVDEPDSPDHDGSDGPVN